jgi:hypothetical protein
MIFGEELDSSGIHLGRISSSTPYKNPSSGTGVADCRSLFQFQLPRRGRVIKSQVQTFKIQRAREAMASQSRENVFSETEH